VFSRQSSNGIAEVAERPILRPQFMNAEPPPSLPGVSAKRRLMLAGIGASLCAATAAWLRWPQPTAQPAPTAKAGPAPRNQPEADAGHTDAASPAPSPATPGGFSRERFLPHLHSMFLVEDANLALRLEEVSPASTIAQGATVYTCFSLLFEGPAGPTVESATYRLNHGELGTLELFLSPVGRETPRPHYEAVFTQRV